jgi:hypothetical protein
MKFDTIQKVLRVLAVLSVVATIVVLVVRTVRRPSPSAPRGASFYSDSSLLVGWYPLQSNLLDVTGQTTSELLSSSCPPVFQINTTLPDNTTGSAWLSNCTGQGVLVADGLWPAQFTVSLWMRLSTAPDSFSAVGSKQLITNNCENGVVVYYSEVDVFASGALSGFYRYTSWQTGVWYHLAVVSNNDVYLNGQPLNAQITGDADPSVPFVIGNDVNLVSDRYDTTFMGNIMGVRLFNVELTDSEVLTLYQLSGQ